jgi:hypothetical protein
MKRGEAGKGCGKTTDYDQIVHTTQPSQFPDRVKIFLKRHKYNLYLSKL